MAPKLLRWRRDEPDHSELLQARFQILFGTLLRVKTHGVIVRALRRTHFPQRGLAELTCQLRAQTCRRIITGLGA